MRVMVTFVNLILTMMVILTKGFHVQRGDVLRIIAPVYPTATRRTQTTTTLVITVMMMMIKMENMIMK